MAPPTPGTPEPIRRGPRCPAPGVPMFAGGRVLTPRGLFFSTLAKPPPPEIACHAVLSRKPGLPPFGPIWKHRNPVKLPCLPGPVVALDLVRLVPPAVGTARQIQVCAYGSDLAAAVPNISAGGRCAAGRFGLRGWDWGRVCLPAFVLRPWRRL